MIPLTLKDDKTVLVNAEHVESVLPMDFGSEVYMRSGWQWLVKQLPEVVERAVDQQLKDLRISFK